MATEVISARRARYEEQGFCVVPGVLPEDVVRRGVEGMDAVRAGIYDTGRPPIDSPWKPGDDPGKLCKIEMPHLASRALFEVITHPAIGRLAAELTGARWVQVWWVQLLYKPPGGQGGTNVGWHQDKQYWKCWTPDSRLFTVWVALSDVTGQSGAVLFVPGSHRWGLIDEGDFYGQSLQEQKESISRRTGCPWREVAATMPAGGVSVHDGLTYHGSGPNTSDGPRRSLAVHMRTEQSQVVANVERIPLEHGRNLVQFLDDPVCNPVIYQA